MNPQRRTLKDAAASLILLGTSSYALAGPAVGIGGLNVSDGPQFGVSQIYQNVITGVGQTLSGYGKVDSINSIPIANLCTSCELTYQFGGYTATSISPTEIRFTGGSYRYYLGFGADNDFTTLNAGGSTGDLAEATNGTLFLALKGHNIDAAGNTLVGRGADIGTLSPTGFSTGLTDVDIAAGGIANAFFNTNAIPALFGSGPSDFEFGSSFTALQPAYPGECPAGPACTRGSADFTGNANSASLTGNGTPALDLADLISILGAIGGLDVSTGPQFGVSQIYQNVITGVGQTLSGYGKVDSINSIPITSLSQDCELTYQFGGYIATSISPTEIRFTGGSYKYYLGCGADNDFSTLNAGGSTGDLAEATNGTLFLALKGHNIDAAGNTLVGGGADIGTLSPTGFSTGLTDVDVAAGGIANAFFNTNAIPALFGSGPSDFEIGSSFTALQPAYPGECTSGGGPACTRGSADFTGAAITAVPEPATIGLVTIALLGLFARPRQNRWYHRPAPSQ